MTPEGFTEFPSLFQNLEDEKTRPTPLDQLPRQVRIEHEMAIVRAHNPRIAQAIEVFWGHKDCVGFLQKLIFDGGHGISRVRMGFKREMVSALINLTGLHETAPWPSERPAS